MSGARYEMDFAGVTAILKSAGVKAELESAAGKKEAEANGLLASHGGDASHGYMHHVKDLTHTAVATVHTAGVTTELDQRRHHTLNAINH